MEKSPQCGAARHDTGFRKVEGDPVTPRITIHIGFKKWHKYQVITVVGRVR